MLKAEDIRDEESLRLWLKSRPSVDGLAISHRAGMRVFPLYGTEMVEDWARQRNLTALPVFRCLLTSGVACRHSAREIMVAIKATVNEAVGVSEDAAAARANEASDGIYTNTGAAIAAGRARAAFTYTAAAFANDDAAAGVDAAARIARNAATDDAAADVWEQTRSDAVLLEQDHDPLAVQLWPDVQPGWFDYHCYKALELWDAKTGDNGRFWSRWYRAAVDGKPQDWDLLREVALIPDDVWAAGVDAVNARIARIEEKYRLKAEVVTQRERLAQAQIRAASDLHRSHNNPPEMVDPVAELQSQIIAIWSALEEAETELSRPDPRLPVLLRIGQGLWDIASKITLYCARLGDIALKKSAEELGTSGAKWVIRSGAVLLAAESETIQSLAKALIEFAKTLP